ncbi:MarR family transcriptional regulator [Breoghania sp.]|uniref:MarR family winged helix-turn-helix transcriptional regulator n=1 Tax=Breoghania sp. TaxID=2065378 RepID=UPI0029CA1EEB|nr:MarR family transcriptional regulator [Breoghania sp.]
MTPEAPDRTITFLLSDIARLIRQHFAEGLNDADLGLTLGEARTLAFVRRLPGRRQSVIAEYLGVEPMTLVGFLDKLEKAGLVVRETDPQDRRAKRITATPAAAPTIARLDAMVGQIRKTAVAGLSEAEIEQAVRLLETLQKNLSGGADASAVAKESDA